MKKLALITNLLFMLVISLCFFATKANAQSISSDIFTITINGAALNATNGLNITVSFTGGTAELDKGVSFKANGAAQLLTDINSATKLITVVWTGAVTDGKATITGKIKAGSKTGNPTLSVVKVEAAGGKDITTSVTSQATISSSTPTPTPSATPSPIPSATPSATPLATPSATPDKNKPGLTLKGPDNLLLTSGRLNFFKLTATGANFTTTSKCTISVSDDTLAKVKPSSFLLNQSRNKKIILVRIPSLTVAEFIRDGLEDVLTVSASCTNGAEDEIDVVISSGASSGK